MSTLKIVKRYANRKLYDTHRSCYVTLEDIAMMIKEGEEVQVIDNKSQEDLTTVTLAQIIFEAEKKKNFMPLDLLRNLVQDSGGVIAQRAAQVGVRAHNMKASAAKLRHEWEGRIERVLTCSQAQAKKATSGLTSRGSMLAELVAASKNAFEELQKNIEDKIKGPMGAVARYASVGRDLREIHRRMADLELRLETMA